jgi:hypothetical protein
MSGETKDFEVCPVGTIALVKRIEAFKPSMSTLITLDHGTAKLLGDLHVDALKIMKSHRARTDKDAL